MSLYIHESYNVSVLLYHIVCPAKYRKVVFSEEVAKVIKEICIAIAKRYEIHFIEIGAVHSKSGKIVKFDPDCPAAALFRSANIKKICGK